MTKKSELEKNLTLEQKVEFGLLKRYVSKLKSTKNYSINDMIRDADGYFPENFVKDVKELYKNNVLPEKIITEELSRFLIDYSKEYPRYATAIYKFFSDHFKKYGKIK